MIDRVDIKSFALRAAKAAGQPSDGDLALINEYTLTEFGADDVYVRRVLLAHNGIDRDREAFDGALLADFARTLPGKGFFVKHPGGWDGDSGPGEGRFFDAQVVEMSLDEARALLREPGLAFPPATVRAKVLEAGFYLARGADNDVLIRKIDAGIASDVSIGFRAADRTPIEGGNGERLGMRLHAPGEAFEGSLVWLGAQPGARVHKQANRNNGDGGDMNDDVKTLQAKLDEQAAQVKALRVKAEAYDALQAALGDELLADPLGLAKACADGKQYRADLIDEVVRLERIAGYVGDSEADVVAAKSLYAGAPLNTLITRIDALAKHAQPEDPRGGDPNNTGATGTAGPAGADGDAAHFNPMANPAVAGRA